MKSFINNPRPIMVTMLKSVTVDDLLVEIKDALEVGTDSFGFQMETLEPEFRTPEYLKMIYSAMGDKPCYTTNYFRFNENNGVYTDDMLTDELFVALKNGAKLIDIRGDLFDANEVELTENPEAVAKQKKVIKNIHELGGEVLMSSHLMRYADKEEVLKIALAQQERGADIAKIVTNADSEDELISNFEILLELKKQLKIEVLFLCNGTHCKTHRLLGPTVTGGMYLCVLDTSKNNSSQPNMSDAKRVIRAAGYDIK